MRSLVSLLAFASLAQAAFAEDYNDDLMEEPATVSRQQGCKIQIDGLVDPVKPGDVLTVTDSEGNSFAATVKKSNPVSAEIDEDPCPEKLTGATVLNPNDPDETAPKPPPRKSSRRRRAASGFGVAIDAGYASISLKTDSGRTLLNKGFTGFEVGFEPDFRIALGHKSGLFGAAGVSYLRCTNSGSVGGGTLKIDYDMKLTSLGTRAFLGAYFEELIERKRVVVVTGGFMDYGISNEMSVEATTSVGTSANESMGGSSAEVDSLLRYGPRIQMDYYPTRFLRTGAFFRYAWGTIESDAKVDLTGWHAGLSLGYDFL